MEISRSGYDHFLKKAQTKQVDKDFELLSQVRHIHKETRGTYGSRRMSKALKAVGYTVGRLGCFLRGDDYGVPTDLPWGMSFPNGLPPTTVRVHPTQLYEAAASLVIFALLVWVIAPRFKREGPLMFAYAVLAGVERFLPAWYASVQRQTDTDFQLWISLDGLEIGAVEETLGTLPPATWVPACAGDTPAQVRQGALARIVEHCDAVVLVDSDDVLHPTRVAAARRGLDDRDVTGCALRLVDEGGRRVHAAIDVAFITDQPRSG
jgi:hypothetical protein